MEPFDSNLSQEEYYKLRTYNEYIKQKGLRNNQSVSLNDIYSYIAANLGEDSAREYRLLLGMYQGVLSRPSGSLDLDNSDDEGQIYLAKNPVEDKEKYEAVKLDADLWQEAVVTTGLVEKSKENAEKVLKNWAKYSKKLDKTVPKKKRAKLYVTSSHDFKYPAPVYWNCENDFRRLEVFFLEKSLESGSIQENIKKQVEEGNYRRVKPGEEKETANRFLSETIDVLPEELHHKYTEHNPLAPQDGYKTLTLEQEQRYILQCLQMLGGSDYFRTDLIAEAEGQSSLYDPWRSATEEWIKKEQINIMNMKFKAKELEETELAQYQSDLAALQKPESTDMMKLSSRADTIDKKKKDIDLKIERYKLQGNQAKKIESLNKDKEKLEKELHTVALRFAVASGQADTWIKKTEEKIKKVQLRIETLNNDIARSENKIEQKTKRIKDARGEMEDFHGDANERKELRNKLYNRMMTLIKNRVEVFHDLTRENRLHDKNGNPAPDNMTDDQALAWLESQGKGQADYYHWILSLDKSLNTMSAHNSIDNIMNSVSLAQNRRADFEHFMETHIDEKYREQGDYKSFMTTIAGDEEAYNIVLEQRNAFKKTMEEKARKWDARETKILILIDKNEDEIAKNDAAIKEDQEYIEDATKRVEKIPAIRKSLNLYDALQPIKAKQLQNIQTYQFINKYEFLNKHFKYNEEKKRYEKKQEVSLDGIIFSEQGKAVKKATTDKLATFVNARFAILKEIVKVEEVSLRGDATEAIAESKDALENIFFSFKKLFSVEQRPTDDKEKAEEWDKRKEEHDKKIAKDKGAAPWGALYGSEKDKNHNALLEDLRKVKTKDGLYAATVALLREVQPYVVRCKTMYELELAEQKRHHGDHDYITNQKKEVDQQILQYNAELNQLDPVKNKSKYKDKMDDLTERIMKSQECSDTLHDLEASFISDKEKKYFIDVFDVLSANIANIDEILYNPDGLAADLRQKVQIEKEIADKREEITKMIEQSESSEMILNEITDLKKRYPGVPNEDLRDFLTLDEKNLKGLIKTTKKELDAKNKLGLELYDKKLDLQALHIKEESAYNRQLEKDKKHLNLLDGGVQKKAESIAALRSIVNYEIPTARDKFNKLGDAYRKAKDKINEELNIRDAQDLYRYVDPATNKVDLDKESHFSGKFRTENYTTFLNYYREARKTTRWFKSSDSQEYVDMMNAVADIVGLARYKTGHEEALEESGLKPITSADVSLETIAERLDIANKKAKEYIKAKESEFRLSPSQMRLDRLKAANRILRDTKAAYDLLKGYSVGKNSQQKTGGLIEKINSMNEAYNYVIKPFGEPEKDREIAKENSGQDIEAQKTGVDKFVDSIPYEKWTDIENGLIDKHINLKSSDIKGWTKAMEFDKNDEFYELCMRPTLNKMVRKAGDKDLKGQLHIDKQTSSWLAKHNADRDRDMIEGEINEVKEAINSVKKNEEKGLAFTK